MYDLGQFGFSDTMGLRGELRDVFAQREPATIEAGAERLVRLFHRELVDADGRPACALVRLYKTHPFAELDDDLKAFVLAQSPEAGTVEDLRCMVLVATAGEELDWNDRRLSKGHRAIPLNSAEAVQAAPMVAGLIQNLGGDIATVVQPTPFLLLDLRSRTEVANRVQSVFFVPTALGSPYIPAQDGFVKPYGICSVLGFGGLLSTGDLVAMILFSRVPISKATADHFNIISLNFKLAMLTLARKPLFGPD